jgi:hypothetical protein
VAFGQQGIVTIDRYKLAVSNNADSRRTWATWHIKPNMNRKDEISRHSSFGGGADHAHRKDRRALL